jgi:phenylacetate-CoA ligase
MSSLLPVIRAIFLPRRQRQPSSISIVTSPVRYRTGDVTMLMEDGCLCRRGKKIARITGRSDDMLVIRGINVFPSQIEHVLLKIPEVGNQFMVYIDKINHLDEMTVEVEINREYFKIGRAHV